MNRRQLYNHFILTDWRGIAAKIKDLKKKNYKTKTKGTNK